MCLYSQNQRVASRIHIRGLQPLENFLITTEEIEKAVGNFRPKIRMEKSKVYKGEFSDGCKNQTTAIKIIPWSDIFDNELQVFPRLHHDNIVPFIGYNDENMIIISKYVSNGGLDDHLMDPSKIRCITWKQRLKICIGAGRGLKYLHLGIGEYESVIHGSFEYY